jgi:hypothetical protein
MPLTIHKRLKPEIPPNSLMPAVHGARNTKRGMLVRHDVVFIFRVWGLVLGRDVDVFDGEEGGDCGGGG